MPEMLSKLLEDLEAARARLYDPVSVADRFEEGTTGPTWVEDGFEALGEEDSLVEDPYDSAFLPRIRILKPGEK